MRLLLIGGAGHLGSIVRPALEQEHTCRYLDIRPVPGAEDRTIVGDVNDDQTVREALEGIDVALYMALGVGVDFSGPNIIRPSHHHDPDAAMRVNVLGVYRMLMHGLDMGVRRYVHASSLSVYDGAGRPYPVDESRPPDAWAPYGLSKRLSEEVCRAAVQKHPEASILALRLVLPMSDEQWTNRHIRRRQRQAERAANPKTMSRPRRRLGPSHGLGPGDARRLYQAAVQFDKPGFHPVQTAGDVSGNDISYQRAYELIGWKPQGQ